MPSDAILTGYDVVDNDYFARRAAKVRERVSLRRRDLGLPEKYFLCSARFIPKKNLARLLLAFAFFLERNPTGNSEGAAWHLVLLGDGPMRAEVEATIDSLGLSSRVHLAGFRQIEELPAFYALAEALILPSTTEQWGLVVNEAMACGLPVVVSERCGCAPDLVEDGRNGFTFDPYDVNALAALLGKIASGHCDRFAMGEASREIISEWSPETFATGLERAVEAALAVPRRDAGILDQALLWALSRR